MQVILIPKDGDAFFGDPIPPDHMAGGSLVRLSHDNPSLATYKQSMADERVNVDEYAYSGVVTNRHGQPIVAVYEQTS
jgi:hypothetical protein